MNTQTQELTTQSTYLDINSEDVCTLLDADGTTIIAQISNYYDSDKPNIWQLKKGLAGKREFYVQGLMSGNYDYSYCASFEEAIQVSIDDTPDEMLEHPEDEEETEEEKQERLYDEFSEVMYCLDSSELLTWIFEHGNMEEFVDPIKANQGN